MGKLGSFFLGALTGAVALGAVSYFVATAEERAACSAADAADCALDAQAVGESATACAATDSDNGAAEGPAVAEA